MDLLYYSSVCQTQRTVTFKSDATIGQDATIWSLDGIQNDNNDHGLPMAAWTWNGVFGTIRTFLKFDELATIPACATIISAELKLYGPISQSGIPVVGNSCYFGSPYNSYCPNQGLIQKVTSSWDEQTVTWNTQPTTTTTNQIIIPASTSQWSYNFTDNSTNLVAMVQNWVSNPATNFGFMTRVEIEARYRCMVFASSDHPVDSLHPELTVTYLLNDSCMDCEMASNFSYTVNTDNLNSYFFKASYPGQSQYWTVDGEEYIYGDNLTYVFSTGNHEVCFYRVSPMYYNTSQIAPTYCEKCITICVGEQVYLNTARVQKNLNNEEKTTIKT
ncbi:MAG: DNRLRE domain-containing protein, partial [Bacteroidales bacterium]|nr:DNRLRE domain-containing protein [Bacteroidales bacterium]